MASHKIPWFLQNLQVNYNVGKCIPLIPTLCQINQIHTLPSYFLKTYFNIILTPTYIKEFQVVPFQRFSYQNFDCWSRSSVMHNIKITYLKANPTFVGMFLSHNQASKSEFY